MEIYVIRHTRVAFEQNRCYGQLDIPLAPTFEKEADRIKGVLPEDIDIIYSSPLSRCLSLAERIGSTDAVIDNRLLEINFGDWEGKFWDDIDSKLLQAWMDDFVHVCPPKGESLIQLSYRVNKFLDHLRDQSGNKIVIITHAGVIRCIWAYLLEIPLNQVFKISVDYGGILHASLGAHRDYDKVHGSISK